MAEGTRLTCVEDISRSNKEEIAALQRGQVETHCKLSETQTRLGAVENRMASVEESLNSIATMTEGCPQDEVCHTWIYVRFSI